MALKSHGERWGVLGTTGSAPRKQARNKMPREGRSRAGRLLERPEKEYFRIFVNALARLATGWNRWLAG
jgi:hypothetical protein